MSESMDEVIPEGTAIARCPYCGKVVSAYEAYFDFYDYYDGFEDNSDPDYGYMTEYAGFRCPYCDESVDVEFYHGTTGFRIDRKDAPPRRSGFSLGKGFSLPAGGQSSLPSGRFSLFNLRRRRR